MATAKTAMSARLTPSLHDAIVKYSETKNIPMNTVLNLALENFFSQQTEKETLKTYHEDYSIIVEKSLGFCNFTLWSAYAGTEHCVLKNIPERLECMTEAIKILESMIDFIDSNLG